MSDHPFSADEQRALDAWPAPPPPPRFAERVLAELGAEQPASTAQATGTHLRQALVAAGLVLAVGLGLRTLLQEHGKAEGEVTATARITVPLHDRGVAVLEPGAKLAWRVADDGAARLEQSAGKIFYRVEPGMPFVVSTDAGTVSVLGTCFALELTPGAGADTHEDEAMHPNSASRPEKSLRKRTLAGAAAAGALVGAVAVVTVYEGTVAAASGGSIETLSAGESAALRADRSPVRTTAPSSSKGAGAINLPDLALGMQAQPAAEPGAVSEVMVLRAEAEGLRREVERLRAEVEASREVVSRDRVHDFTEEDLLAMAKQCELRWDMFPVGAGEPMEVPDNIVESLDLTPAEVKRATEVLEKYRNEQMALLGALYTEVTGNPDVEALAAWSMMSEINDKAPPGQMQEVFMRLSHERAGLPVAPRMGPEPALERMYRYLLGTGDQLESALGQAIGDDRAAKWRDGNRGWGSRSRSSQRCPQ